MKKQVLFLLLSLSMGLFNALQAQSGTPTAPTTIGEYIQNQWTVYAYNRSFSYSQQGGFQEETPNFRGYYIDTNTYGVDDLNIDSELSWDIDKSPSSNNSSYMGYIVLDNLHIVDYRRKGFPAGYYQLNVGHDNAGLIALDGAIIYYNPGVTQNYTLPSLIYLDENSELALRWEEDFSDSHGRLEFTKLSQDFGDGEWQVSVFNDRTFTNFAGIYTQSGLSFSAPWPHDNNNTPSNAPGYVGEEVDQYNSYSYKRKNFPCGFYRLDVLAHDDNAELLIDGVSVWTRTGWSTDEIEDVWFGYLGADSKVEMRIVNTGGGPTTAGLEFNRLDDANANETVWTGRQDSNTSNPANWCPAMPDNTSDVYIPPASLTANSPVLNADLNVGTLRMDPDAIFDMSANKLTVFGSMMHNNTWENAHIRHLVMESANSEFTGKKAEIDILEVKANGVSINLDPGESLRINEVVKIINGTLETNGKLTLACRFDDMTQRVAQIDNLDNATITGNVITEQCIPARRAFRFISSPVTTTTTIHENWQEGAGAYNDNPNPGYGTHITGTQGNADQWNGFDYTPGGNPSLFTFDNATQSWAAVDNTNASDATLEAGKPYYFMVRGSRAINVHSNTAIPDNTILRATGSVRQGDIDMATNFNANANTFNFFGNPYPAAVDMVAVMSQATHIQKDYYLWDPNLGGAVDYNTDSNNLGGRGAYVTIDLESPGASAVPSDSDANQFLQPGQAAFVKASGTGIPQMLFKESYKNVQANQTDVFRFSENTISFMDVNLYEASDLQMGETALDGFRIKFSDTYTTDVTEEDAAKFGNLDENIAVANGEDLLAIDRRNFPAEEEIVPLFTNQYRNTAYTLTFDFNNWTDLSVYLVDYYLGTETAITLEDNLYSFNIDADMEASTDANRFALKFSTENLGVEENTLETNWVLYPNPVKSGEQVYIRLPKQEQGKWKVNITDMLGKQVWQQEKTINAEGMTLNDLNLSPGVYLVRLQSTQESKTYTKKLLVK